MINLTIDNKKYIIPTRLTIDQWKQLIKFDFADYLQYSKIISVLTGAESEKIIQCTDDSQILAVGFIINLMNQRKEHKIREFNDIMFGEFIDLDIYLIAGVEKNLDIILKTLTKSDQEVTKWADEALWLIDRYTQFRVYTYRQYAGLFDINKNGQQEFEDETEELEALDYKKVAKNWYKIIIDLADNDLQKIDYVTDQPLKKVFNFMAYRKEKQIEENFKLLQQKRALEVNRRK